MVRVHGKGWSAGVGELLVLWLVLGMLVCGGLMALGSVIRENAAAFIVLGVALLGCAVFVVQYRIRHRP